MDKLINNLNNREKLLIAIAVSVIFIFVIFAFSNNVLNLYTYQIKNYLKLKKIMNMLFQKQKFLINLFLNLN